MKKERKVTLGQHIGASVLGMLCCFGTSTLVSGICSSIVDATSCGKMLKFCLKAGSWGIGLTAGKMVNDTVTETTEELFSAINGIREGITDGKENNEVPLTTNEANVT